MVNHGLSTGGLFILVGLIYDRTHTRQIAEYGGIWAVVPIFSALFLVVTLGVDRACRARTASSASS